MKSYVYPNFAELSHDSPMILSSVDDQLGDYTTTWGRQDS